LGFIPEDESDVRLLSAEPFWVRRLSASPTYNPRRTEAVVPNPSRAMKKSAAGLPTESVPSVWVYGPWLDLIVGCGAWSAPLLLLAYYASRSSALGWSIAFYGLALFFNYPHYMATIYRAYHNPADFHKYRIFTVHITALIALTLILSHFWFRAIPWIFTLYLIWSPWHYSGQNYGLFMMFARRGGATPSVAGRRALYSAFLISYLILLLSFLTGPSNDPLFVSPGIPERISYIAVLALGVVFVACSAYGWSELGRQLGWRRLLPALTLFSTQCLWFLLPTVLSLAEGLRVPQSRYSSGVFAVMHSAQYIWITSYYARREAGGKGASGWRPFAYFAALVAGGIALFVPGPWLASRLFHRDFGASFLIFTALVNIHHFILDGAIWKLRDSRIATLLLNSRAHLSDATADAGRRWGSSLRWVFGNSWPARTLRIAATIVLLAWGSIDQVHYYLALHQESLPDLKRAAALDSYDSSLQTHLGWKELKEGQFQEAAAAWNQALQVNPTSAAPRDALLNYLTQKNRYDEAYALTTRSLRHAPKDVNLLVNHGILANQLGHGDEAIQSWKQAIALDGSQVAAYLYTAGELDREGKPEAAIPYYMMFLNKVAQAGASSRPPAHELIAIVLRLAQCQIQANHFDQAAKSYELAQKIAVQSGEVKMESAASLAEAELKSGQGKTAEALALYQHALELDGKVDDSQTTAIDLYSYGLFLRDAGLSPRLAYACILKAQSLMQPLKNTPAYNSVATAREELEKKLATQAAVLKRNPDPAVQEALNLTFP
jgi:tetratricopeptide (TPR) repeat protein